MTKGKIMLWLAAECAEVWKLSFVMLMAPLPRIFYHLSAKQWHVSVSSEMHPVSQDQLNVLQNEDYILLCVIAYAVCSGPCFFRNTRSDNLVDRLHTPSPAVPQAVFCLWIYLTWNYKFHSTRARIRICALRRKERLWLGLKGWNERK